MHSGTNVAFRLSARYATKLNLVGRNPALVAGFFIARKSGG
jgi:hypothetical protein